MRRCCGDIPSSERDRRAVDTPGIHVGSLRGGHPQGLQERTRIEERDAFDGLPVPEEEAIDRGHAHLSPADVRPQRELEEQRVSGRAPALDLSAEVRHEREEIPERLLAGIEPDRGRQPRRLQAAIGMENSAEAFGIDRRPPEVRELRDERPGSIFRRLAPLLTTKGAKLGGNALDGKAELLAHRVYNRSKKKRSAASRPSRSGNTHEKGRANARPVGAKLPRRPRIVARIVPQAVTSSSPVACPSSVVP